MEKLLTLLTCLLLILSCESIEKPSPVYPIPSEDQIAWQEMEFYGFLHFNMNTFTNIEWGYGDKSPELFHPTAFDAKQWARVASEAGMKGLIITAKHHDGFCLWPSDYTEHSVKNSKWKNGKGDVLKELSEACQEYGIKMGVYLSPWDRNHADYGKPEYIDYFRNQLTELLTNYGDIYEVWFDGANGGDGYYGGANEIRKVDKLTYYDWENTYKLVKKLQPNAVIFSDSGPGVRWVGNEHGFAYKTTWSPLLRDSVYGGMPGYSKKYSMGQEDGSHWVPAEADVSIRPGWYYHKSEDDKVKSLEHLLDIYYKSVGQNSTLLLNFPVDDRGLIHENDVIQLKKMTAQLKEDFAQELALNKNSIATNIRGGSSKFDSKNVNDGDKNTYWTTDDGIVKASVTIEFDAPTEINRFLIQEYITLGQRVKKFSLEAEVDGKWITIENQTTIGYKRILRFRNIIVTKLRLNIDDAKASPLISNIEIYNAPLIVDAPLIYRNKEGIVELIVPEDGADVYYTLDGSEPSINSTKYIGAFVVHQPTVIKTFSVDSKTDRKSEVNVRSFNISKKTWKILGVENKTAALKAIDDNSRTNYTTQKEKKEAEIVIDLGKIENIKAFTYTPSQSKYAKNVIVSYRFYGSLNTNNWKLLSQGEFSNIIANPIQQKIDFDSSYKVKYIKLVAHKISDHQQQATFSEIGVITN